MGTHPEFIDVRRVDGCGERVKELADRLDTVDAIALPVAMLDELSKGTEEWFFDIQAELPDRDLRFGINDSTAMFVDGDEALLNVIASVFTDFVKE